MDIRLFPHLGYCEQHCSELSNDWCRKIGFSYKTPPLYLFRATWSLEVLIFLKPLDVFHKAGSDWREESDLVHTNMIEKVKGYYAQTPDIPGAGAWAEPLASWGGFVCARIENLRESRMAVCEIWERSRLGSSGVGRNTEGQWCQWCWRKGNDEWKVRVLVGEFKATWSVQYDTPACLPTKHSVKPVVCSNALWSWICCFARCKKECGWKQSTP